MHGDLRAAHHLFQQMSAGECAGLIVEMYREHAPMDVYRYLLRWSWLSSWRALYDAVGDDLSVVHLFMRANFEIPNSMGQTVKAYRGTCGISPEHAAFGMSWTLDRDVACHFAHVWNRDGTLGPLVIEADIPRAHILMYEGLVGLAEIVVIPIAVDPSIHHQVSLPVDDWFDGHMRHKASIKRQDEKREELFRKSRELASMTQEEMIGG